MRRYRYRGYISSTNNIRLDLFVLAFLLFIFVACSSQPTLPPLAAKNGILWKIEKEGIKPSYILGTVHAEDPRVLRVVDDVKPIFAASRKLMLEVPLDKASSQEAMSAMLYDESKTLKDTIGGKRFDQVITLLQNRGFPSIMISRMKPWAVFTILNMPESDTGVFLDALFYQKAMNSGMAFESLETIEEQTSLFDKLPIKLQLALLDDTLKNIDVIDQDLNKAIDAYLSRNLDRIVELQDDLLKRTQPALHNFYTEQLISNRNRKMAERMQASLQQGSIFIAIGALHLPGPNGVLNLLSERGFKVTAIY